MRKHRKLLIAAACLGLATAVVLLLVQDNEPRYNGRPLSKWVQAYSEQPPVSIAPQPTEAVRAMRAIGTNALPFLLKWIQQQPPAWHRTGWNKLPESITRTTLGRLVLNGPGYERADAAMHAFEVLGTNAAPAIPELVALMRDTNAPAQ